MTCNSCTVKGTINALKNDIMLHAATAMFVFNLAMQY